MKEKRCVGEELRKNIGNKSEHYNQKINYLWNEEYLLNADWSLVNRAFEYLIDNACKFGGKNGDVTVSILRNEAGLLISVKDCGAGLNKETINRIFEGLFSEDILHHKEGSGLSLPVCRLIMIHHNGKLTCENSPDGERSLQCSSLSRLLSPVDRNPSRREGGISLQQNKEMEVSA